TNITKTLQHRRRPSHNRRAGPRRHRRRAHGRPGSDRAATSKQVAETRPRAAEPHAVQRRHLRLECGAHSRPVHENIPLLALPVLVPTAIRHAACNKRTGHTLLTPLHPRHARRRSRHRCPARLLHHHHHLHRLLLLHALDNLVTLREVRYLQKPLHIDGPGLEQLQRQLIPKLLVHLQAASRLDIEIQTVVHLRRVPLQKLLFAGLPTYTNNPARRVKLQNPRHHQPSHTPNHILQVARFIPNPRLPSLLQHRNSRRRRHLSRASALRHVMDTRDGLHVPHQLHIEVKQVRRKRRR